MRAFNAVFLNRVTPTAVRNAACFIAAASISVGMLYVAKKEADKNHAWYLSLSPEKQKEVYNNCPEQKLGNSGDAMGAMFLSNMANNTEQHKHISPRIPYNDNNDIMYMYRPRR